MGAIVSLKKPRVVPGSAACDHDYAIARKRMVREQLLARGIRDEAILRVMLKLPRHRFVDAGMAPLAYNDHPIQIGEAQTLSQAFTVASMLEQLHLKPVHRVLEIGTGSGYLTALLAELVAQVYSMERLPNLLFRARQVLKGLHYKNIVLKLGDGSKGWLEQAPFDAIVVSAGSPQIPQPYFEQLREGGRMILPVGSASRQELTLVEKQNGQGRITTLSECRFVKLKGEHGFKPS